MGLTMALETDGPDIATDQKETIGRPVGGVTDLTPFYLYREMFKNPGTSLLRMAFKAGIDIKLVPCPQVGPCPSPVRRVTIRAFHGALYYPMVVGEIKFGLNVQMT